MRKVRNNAEILVQPLLATIAVQALLVFLIAPTALSQGRSLGYTTQPFTPGRPLGAPGVYNHGGVFNSGFNHAGFSPSYVAPSYGIPQAMSGGNYMINGNPFYYSNSGYYYPWANNSAYGQIIYSPAVNQAPTVQIPPLSTVFQDLLKYLDEKKAKGTITEADYKHLRRRATDLQTKYFSLRSAAEGNIDPSDEAQIRRDMDELGAEVSKAVSG